MTAFTAVSGIYVAAVLACCRRSVMTACTITYTRRVREVSIGPAAVWVVAIFTGIATRNMVG